MIAQYESQYESHHNGSPILVRNMCSDRIRRNDLVIFQEIVRLNPQISLEKIKYRTILDKNNYIKKLNLSHCGLTILPDNINKLFIKNPINLDLSYNQLTELPEIRMVIGSLNLSYNNITELSESFCDYIVIGNLDLSHNRIETLSESFGNLEIGGNLDLSHNRLETLPESFGNLDEIGGNLDLSHNRITLLPESFKSLKIGGSLYINDNKLTELPESFGNIEIQNSVYT